MMGVWFNYLMGIIMLVCFVIAFIADRNAGIFVGIVFLLLLALLFGGKQPPPPRGPEY